MVNKFKSLAVLINALALFVASAAASESAPAQPSAGSVASKTAQSAKQEKYSSANKDKTAKEIEASKRALYPSFLHSKITLKRRANTSTQNPENSN